MIDGATADAINKVQGAASKLSGEASAAVVSTSPAPLVRHTGRVTRK